MSCANSEKSASGSIASKLAMAARAASEAVGNLCPVTVTGHFLNPGKPGPVSIDVAVEKQGSRFTTAWATMLDGKGPVLTMLGSFAGHGPPSSIELVEEAPPELPDPVDCLPMEPTDTFPPPFVGKVELRLHPEDASFAAGVPRMRGWFRLRDSEPIDCLALLLAVDAFPPTVFNTQLPVAWTPTLELTTHVRGRAEPGWLRCQFTTRFITGGFLEADGEVWDAPGRLVAQSRQLALVPR